MNKVEQKGKDKEYSYKDITRRFSNYKGETPTDHWVNIFTLNTANFKNTLELFELLQLLNKIMGPEDVIILQEMPHKSSKKLHREFQGVFSGIYKTILPDHLIPSRTCTVAVFKEGSGWERAKEEKFQYCKEFRYGNKVVEVENNKLNITVMGLHVAVTHEMWGLIENSISRDKPSFLVGDFNAYEKRGKMRDKPRMIRDIGFHQTISSDIITNFKYNSSIDNIFINKEETNLLGGKSYVMKLSPDVFSTDHALCYYRLKIKK